MNSVCLIGNLVRDPELRYTTGGNALAVCSFTIAINRAKDGADFPKIKAFGKTAENCDRYLSKGRKVAVMGRLQTGSYEKDGVKHYTTEVIADRVIFLNGVQTEEPKKAAYDVPPNFEQLNDDTPF